MPKQSKIEPVIIPEEKWLKIQDPPKGVFEGHPYGVNCVVIRYFYYDKILKKAANGLYTNKQKHN